MVNMSLPPVSIAMLSILFALLLGQSAATKVNTDSSCRSNSTHIAWRGACSPITDTADATATANASPSRRLDSPSLVTTDASTDVEGCCSWQTVKHAERDAYRFLRQHVMKFDLAFLETLGFDDDDDDDAQDLPDGLSGGLVGPTIQLALQAKIQFDSADALPIAIWQEYVLNPFNVNEGRTNWRPHMWNKLSGLVEKDMSIGDIVEILNTFMWKILAPADADCITFVSSETPLIFDPMSVLVFGHASCTGLAILFSNALRTVGVPARVAGTPAWYQNRDAGNHNWVEVWDDGAWKFLEPSPNQTVVDTLDRDPCLRWFCSSQRFTDTPTNTTLVASARLKSDTSNFFRLAWEWKNANVPAEDRSDYYQRACSSCP